MAYYGRDNFDKYEAGTVELFYSHTRKCRNFEDDNYMSYQHKPTKTCTPVALARLPHQCERWCIGRVEDVERMIADLQAAVVKMKGRKA